MTQPLIITSVQNPGIRELQKLIEKPAHRKKANLVVIEGMRENLRALESGWKITRYFWSRGSGTEKDWNAFRKVVNRDAEAIEVSQYVFEKIATRDSSHGIVSLAVRKNFPLSEVVSLVNPFFLVIEGVEKPGNLGAILRTASAAGVDAVLSVTREQIYTTRR
jgi:TrmH family RNA methyltransferase